MVNQLSAKQGEGSFIAAGTRLEGQIAFTGPTIVSGHLKGDVIADGLLVIEAGAIVDGSIDGTLIVVHGTLTGTISASDMIEAFPGCRIEGRAYAPSMRVDGGATVLADLLIAPVRPADWNAPKQAAPGPQQVRPQPSPKPVQADIPAPAPLPPFVNTMFSQPAKTSSGS
ncbi:bactofilin family protein [Hyphomonas oceanitis]|uniref:Putative lipoprotein n=1 Tax=Hyphomonas oceanitis SCH89 TaxID=1280953 RepID=A0A059G8V5_9PROT|nr:polymer-forming cytoskeletal protein [Hyphomonas oceanitis]KDA03282.1 putative lipoprotein [Hyphomonas oceanitis SCH89]